MSFDSRTAGAGARRAEIYGWHENLHDIIDFVAAGRLQPHRIGHPR